MQFGDIVSYRQMCNVEEVETLQRGMNYRLKPTYSVLLMSTRSNSPYDDEVQDEGRVLIYEGHDTPKSNFVKEPKSIDQPMYTRSGRLTQNGLFFESAKGYKQGNNEAETVHVYEKIQSGIWVFNGVFFLVDAWQEVSNSRNVFRFKLQLKEDVSRFETHLSQSIEIEHSRIIPSSVKLEVWQRDKGQCVKCGSTTNLHFDHIIPYSRGGTSLSAKNIQLLCMACNLSKSNKIE